jgi:hypothetical protein
MSFRDAVQLRKRNGLKVFLDRACVLVHSVFRAACGRQRNDAAGASMRTGASF